MYNLHLTAEQQEFRDTVRDFVSAELKPVVLHPDRLQYSPWEAPVALTEKASQLGLRTLLMPEELDGAGADALTACIVAEELAAGDAGIATTLVQTWSLARFLFAQAMSAEQRARYLPAFARDDTYHLACAPLEYDLDRGWQYHRPLEGDGLASGVRATRQGNGDWVLDGATGFVANAPVAKLFAVQVRTGGGVETLLVARDNPGLAVREPHTEGRGAGADGEPLSKWYLGSGGTLHFTGCRVAAHDVLAARHAAPLAADRSGRGAPQAAAINLGIGRAAYEAAVEYAKIRVQGARPIIQHQAIGTILARVAVKIEVARNMIWHAAWASDHPEAYSDRSVSGLPLETIASVYTAEAMHEAAEEAGECFGAMGVMLDMPLPKYINETRMFLHSGDSSTVALLRIAEALAGYERTPAPARARAAA